MSRSLENLISFVNTKYKEAKTYPVYEKYPGNVEKIRRDLNKTFSRFKFMWAFNKSGTLIGLLMVCLIIFGSFFTITSTFYDIFCYFIQIIKEESQITEKNPKKSLQSLGIKEMQKKQKKKDKSIEKEKKSK